MSTVVAALEAKRSDASSAFAKVFLSASKLWEELDMDQNDLTIPAAVRRKSLVSETVEGYYRRAVYIPMLDSIMVDLKQRLEIFRSPSTLLSNFVGSGKTPTESDIGHLIRKYGKHLPVNCSHLPKETQVSIVAAEIAQWNTFREDQEYERDAISSLNLCDAQMFPNINTL